jgi:hypothetical protein
VSREDQIRENMSAQEIPLLLKLSGKLHSLVRDRAHISQKTTFPCHFWKAAANVRLYNKFEVNPV